MKTYKIVFLITLITGTLITISSYSWLGMWMGLEINLLSIIPMLKSYNNQYSSESSMKYFITQAMASLIFLMAIILLLKSNEFITPSMNKFFKLMVDSSLLTKLGAAPFHYWFPEMIEGINWINSLIMMTWQKIAPMVVLMNSKMNEKMMMMSIMASLLISTIMSLNQISLRKVMAYSSINHIAWMIANMQISMSTWMNYMIIYSINTINIIMLFAMTKTFYINQMNNILSSNKMIKLTLLLNFLSLAGLPPFLGFLPKWLTINWLINSNLMLTAIIMIITTLIMIFVYLRVIIPSLILTTSKLKMPELNLNKKPLMFSNMITMTSILSYTIIWTNG